MAHLMAYQHSSLSPGELLKKLQVKEECYGVVARRVSLIQYLGPSGHLIGNNNDELIRC